MKFEKHILKEMEDLPNFEVISDEIYDNSRWSILHQRIFKYQGKFYSTCYSVGSTEYQDESPYEYDPNEIECPEVYPHLVTTVVYKSEPPQGQLFPGSVV